MVNANEDHRQGSRLNGLREYMRGLACGPVPAAATVAELLERAWHELRGGNETSMDESKLWRIENVQWHPPLLSFKIERHGGAVMGSSRAEMYAWSVDIETGTAKCERCGYRQLVPADARLDVKPIAKEIAKVIINQEQDPRVKRYPDGRVRVLAARFIPSDGPKQTGSCQVK